MARYVSHAGLPVVGYTGRFLKNWGDFGTVVSLPQMKTQLGIQLTSGIACGVGDHMHSSGQVEPSVYDVIREGFRFAKARQPYCTGIERTREVAICAPAGVESNTAVAGKTFATLDVWNTIYSAAKRCMEGHFQWDVIDPDMDLDGLECVIQCHARVDEAWLEKVSGFVERGGTLLLDAAGILATGPLAARWLEFLGLTDAQWSDHPGSYYRVQEPALAAGVPDMANYVHAPSMAVSLAPGACELAQTLYPPCARSREAFYGHFHGCDTEPGGPAVIETRRRNGRILVFTQDILTAYLETGYHAHRSLMLNALRSLLPNPIVTTDAPAIMDVVVGSLDGSCVVQAMPFVSDRRHRTSFESITESIPLGPCQITVRTGAPAKRVWNPVDGREVPFRNTDKGAAFTLPAISEHTILLIEPGGNQGTSLRSPPAFGLAMSYSPVPAFRITNSTARHLGAAEEQQDNLSNLVIAGGSGGWKESLPNRQPTLIRNGSRVRKTRELSTF